jgi:hypothetical protein
MCFSAQKLGVKFQERKLNRNFNNYLLRLNVKQLWWNREIVTDSQILKLSGLILEKKINIYNHVCIRCVKY